MQPHTPELWHTGTQLGAFTVLTPVLQLPAQHYSSSSPLRDAAEPYAQPRPAGIWHWFQQPRTNSDYKPFILGFTRFSELHPTSHSFPKPRRVLAYRRLKRWQTPTSEPSPFWHSLVSHSTYHNPMQCPERQKGWARLKQESHATSPSNSHVPATSLFPLSPPNQAVHQSVAEW